MEETDELRRFREEWKREVQQRHDHEHAPHSGQRSHHFNHARQSTSDLRVAREPNTMVSNAAAFFENIATTAIATEIPSNTTARVTAISTPLERNNGEDSNGAVGGAAAVLTSSTRSGGGIGVTARRSGKQTALELYSQAVVLEEKGQPDQATTLYARAFKLDLNVDKAYHRVIMERELQGLVKDVGGLALSFPGGRRAYTATQMEGPSTSAGTADATGHEKPSVRHRPRANTRGADVTRTASRILRAVLDSFPPLNELGFEAEEEKHPVHLNLIPDEIIIQILQMLVDIADIGSIERFASVSRKARVITLDSSLWRTLVERSHVNPQITYKMEDAIASFGGDYRQLYICHPRVRLDGVYIAACQYVRIGHSENAWVNETHLITYRRYLRFFPNGLVYSMLSSDNAASSREVISLLRTDGPHMKGLRIGRWRVEEQKRDDGGEGTEAIVVLTGLMDAAILGHGNAPNANAKYTFTMRLGLRTKPLGRWNKLDILTYESVRIGSGEATLLPLKHEKPFWFSKVRSYGSGLELQH